MKYLHKDICGTMGSSVKTEKLPQVMVLESASFVVDTLTRPKI